MSNQVSNGVLDLGACNPPMGDLILPPGTKKVLPLGMKAPSMEETKKDSSKIPAKDWDFEKFYGFKPPKAVGPYMIVELYAPKLSDVIAITGQTRSGQKWISNVGRLISLGSACFKGEQFQHWSEDDIPKIGEWIHFKHNAGPVNKFREIDIVTMYDESINMQLENPEHVTRD